MRIRPLATDDVDRLVVLCAEHAAYEGVAVDPETWDAEGKATRLRDMALGQSSRLKIWLLDDENTSVGFASFALEASTWEADEYLHLDCLYLCPEARGHGWGRRLLQHGVDEARRLGLREIQWQTPIWNEDAIRFYRRLGATEKEKLRFSWAREAWPKD